MSQNNNNQNNRNRPSNNRVRGPTSALTSFLREHNISIENRSRRARREEREAATVNTEDGEPMEGVVQTEVAAQSSSSTTTETTTLLYTPSKKTAKGKKKRGRESDSSEDDDDDAKYAPSSSRKVVPGRSRIVFCSECKGRFARKIENDDQTVCNDCINGTTAANKKKATTRKKQIVSIKKDSITKETVPSLQDVCIAVVVDYIEDVDTLGVISEESLEKIAKIISRNRKLNDVTARLFMEPFKRRLDLYDCTGMNEVSLLNISQFCPRLEHLNLVYCGHITDQVVKAYYDKLHFLKSIHLSGAFLVKKETWNEFFEKVGTRFESFGLRYSARLLKENIDCLVKHCPNVRELKFGHLSAMNSDWLAPISTLKKLQVFEFAWPAMDKQLNTEDLVDMLSKVGPQLTELSIKGGHDLDDKFITEGILKHCRNLKKLSLEQCGKLTAKAMTELFKSWDNKGLTHLDLGRCLLFDDQVLWAIIRHSGATLKHLSIHSLEEITSTGLEALGGGDIQVNETEVEKFSPCTELTHLDCGFVRAMDDFVLKKVVDNCTSLEKVQVWGCHLLTNTIKDTSKLTIIGRESSALRA